MIFFATSLGQWKPAYCRQNLTFHFICVCVCVCVHAITPTDKAPYMDPHISVKDEPTSDDDVTHSWCNPVQPSQMDYSHEGKLGYIYNMFFPTLKVF